MASCTYRVVITGGTFLPCQDLSMNIRNHCLSIRNFRLGICNHRLGIRDRHMSIDHYLGLEGDAKSKNSRAEPSERTLKT